MTTTQNIGWIGTGVMGLSMCGHLIDAGHRLTVFNRTREKAAPLLDKGAAWAETPGEVARSSDIVFTMVGFPKDVDAVILGDDGVLAGAKPGATVVDMTTSSPDLARTIYRQGLAKGVQALDAPVSGGDVGARQAALAIMNTELMLKAQVIQEELESRKLIEKAKEILVRRRGLDVNSAFRWIQKRSMDSRKSMRAVAEAILLSEDLGYYSSIPHALKKDIE